MMTMMMELEWVEGFEIAVSVQNDAVVVSANRQGLLSLARHLTTLADARQRGAHLHLDEHNSLDDGSCELLIERTD